MSIGEACGLTGIRCAPEWTTNMARLEVGDRAPDFSATTHDPLEDIEPFGGRRGLSLRRAEVDSAAQKDARCAPNHPSTRYPKRVDFHGFPDFERAAAETPYRSLYFAEIAQVHGKTKSRAGCESTTPQWRETSGQ